MFLALRTALHNVRGVDSQSDGLDHHHQTVRLRPTLLHPRLVAFASTTFRQLASSSQVPQNNLPNGCLASALSPRSQRPYVRVAFPNLEVAHLAMPPLLPVCTAWIR